MRPPSRPMMLAVARPMPLAAAVISATLPLNRMGVLPARCSGQLRSGCSQTATLRRWPSTDASWWPRAAPAHTAHWRAARRVPAMRAHAPQPRLMAVVLRRGNGTRDGKAGSDADAQDRRRHHHQHHRARWAVAEAGGHVPDLRSGSRQAASGRDGPGRFRPGLRQDGHHLPDLRRAHAEAHGADRYLHRRGQGLSAADGFSQAAVARRFPRRRPELRGHHARVLHAPAHRPHRLEHEAAQRPLGADLSEREIHLPQGRICVLGGDDEARRQSARQRVDLQLPADRRGRPGAAGRRYLSARRHLLAHPDARPFAASLLRRHPLEGPARDRHRRHDAPCAAVPRAGLVDHLRHRQGAGRKVAPRLPWPRWRRRRRSCCRSTSPTRPSAASPRTASASATISCAS